MDQEARIMEEMTQQILHDQDQEILKVFKTALTYMGMPADEAARRAVELFTQYYGKPPSCGNDDTTQSTPDE